MLDTWLNYTANTTSSYTFKLIDVSEKLGANKSIEAYLGEKLLLAYRDLDFLKEYYAHSPKSDLENYLNTYVLPSDDDQLSKNVAQGDFGETLASLVVTHFCKLVVPIHKLRWKFNRDKSVFCTDMIAHNDGALVTNIHYYEVKTRLAIRKEKVGEISNHVTVNAHNSLLKDENAPNEGIADFLSKLYFENKDFKSAKKYNDIVKNPDNYSRNYELLFVIEKSRYDKQILDDLENLPPSLKPLNVTIILIENLKDLLGKMRTAIMGAAMEYVYGKPTTQK